MGEQIQQDDDVDGTAPGPDERDLDLMDGRWEQEYYSGRIRTRDWNAVGVGVALLVIASLVIPMFLVLTR
ncbi:MAG TPA: hypothetical protein PL082_05090 [Tepidiformaceae bacterium]|nr:hypothetical protein [Tepidiformaceae bacterium]